MKDAEITQYLSRIKLDACSPTLEGLTSLQEQHMAHIPFENLDIVVGRKIGLDRAHLFKKLIVKKRGGYCFELNTLYAGLLTALGFFPKPVLGRVWLSNPKRMPPRNHLAYIVKLEGRSYITDVGFGGLITRIPLDIHVPAPIRDKVGMVRIVPFADQQFMIKRQTEKGWMNLYSFENVAISEEDIDISNHYMSTHSNSHFFYHKFVGKNTEDGRIGLFNNKIATRKGIKVVAKQRVDFGAAWLETLKNDFFISLDFSEQELKLLFGNKLNLSS